MTYQPNFNSKAVRSRAQRILDWLDHKMLGPRPISRRELHDIYGNTSREPARTLKAMTLKTVKDHYNMMTGECKCYKKSSKGIEQLRSLMDHKFTATVQQQQELETGLFDYTEKSSRIWHSLQFLERSRRGRLLDNMGYRYHYDICAAAPTLLRQLTPTKTLPTLDLLIQDRSQIRQQIAQESAVTVEQVKTVINALLQGSRLSTYYQSKLLQELDNDYSAIQRLQRSQTLTLLRRDISEMWSEIAKTQERTTITDKNGKIRLRPLSSKDKSQLYRSLELEVGKVIRGELRRQGVRALWIHDGWSCDKFVVPSDIERLVKRKTGYAVTLDWGIYEG